MPTDVLDVLVEEVTTDPWSDFFEGPSLVGFPTCWCCHTPTSDPEDVH